MTWPKTHGNGYRGKYRGKNCINPLDKMRFCFVKVISVPFKSTFVIKMITPKILANCAKQYLTIIPRARMGSESIAHEGKRNNPTSWSKISRQNNFSQLKLDLNPFLRQKASAFSLPVDYHSFNHFHSFNILAKSKI